MADTGLTQEQKRRKAALRGMETFADQHGVTNRVWREEDRGDAVVFIGETDEGRTFSLGYEKVTACPR